MSKRHLAIRTQIEEQVRASAVELACKHARRDVATYVSSDATCKIARPQIIDVMNISKQGKRRERIHADGVGGQADGDMLHDRVASNCDRRHVCLINASRFAQLGLHLT